MGAAMSAQTAMMLSATPWKRPPMMTAALMALAPGGI